MEFNRIKHRKKPNNKRGIILVLLLFVIIYMWYNMDAFMQLIFPK